MKRYLLDTDICIDLLRGRAPGVFEHLRRRRIDQVAISSITLAELQYGVQKSNRPEYHQTLLIEFCAPLAIEPFDDVAAEAYGQVRADLERRGVGIGPMDTLIAAHAIRLNATLVTNNLREFNRVEGLATENWVKR